MRVLVALVIACGCGRIGFDPNSHGGDGGGDDDGGVTCVPAPEVCNGIDDDCNDLVDEGCACTPFDITVAMSLGLSGLAWTGDGCFVLTNDSTNYLLTRLDANAAAIGNTVLGARSALAFSLPEVFAWTGSELGVVWTRAGHVELARFDGTGAPLGTTLDVNMSTAGTAPVMYWSVDHFAIAWNESNAIAIREVAADGTPLTPVLATGVPRAVDWISPGAGGYVLATGNQTAEAPGEAIVGRDGHVISSLVFDPAATDQAFFQLVRGPGGFAATWDTGNQSNVSFVALDDAAQPTTSVITLPAINNTAIDSAMAAVPGGYAVYALQSSSPQTLAYEVVDALGSVTAGPTTFGSINIASSGPAVLVTAAGRELFALPIIAPTLEVRVVQQCR